MTQLCFKLFHVGYTWSDTILYVFVEPVYLESISIDQRFLKLFAKAFDLVHVTAFFCTHPLDCLVYLACLAFHLCEFGLNLMSLCTQLVPLLIVKPSQAAFGVHPVLVAFIEAYRADSLSTIDAVQALLKSIVLQAFIWCLSE